MSFLVPNFHKISTLKFFKAIFCSKFPILKSFQIFKRNKVLAKNFTTLFYTVFFWGSFLDSLKIFCKMFINSSVFCVMITTDATSENWGKKLLVQVLSSSVFWASYHVQGLPVLKFEEKTELEPESRTSFWLELEPAPKLVLNRF